MEEIDLDVSQSLIKALEDLELTGNEAITRNAVDLISLSLHYNPFPLSNLAIEMNENKVFDFIEFLYNYVSKPINGQWYDETTDTGWNYQDFRYESFNESEGQEEFRDKVNRFLPYYDVGYELNKNGQIQRIEKDLSEILDKELPNTSQFNFTQQVQDAVAKFRNRQGNLSDKKSALQDLAGINEQIREYIKDKKYLTQDETQLLFKIFGETANSFAIRHQNSKQKVDYKEVIFYTTLFHIYLATIHAGLNIISDKENNPF